MVRFVGSHGVFPVNVDAVKVVFGNEIEGRRDEDRPVGLARGHFLGTFTGLKDNLEESASEAPTTEGEDRLQIRVMFLQCRDTIEHSIASSVLAVISSEDSSLALPLLCFEVLPKLGERKNDMRAEASGVILRVVGPVVGPIVGPVCEVAGSDVLRTGH